MNGKLADYLDTERTTPEMLPHGEVTLLVGTGGVGKSTVSRVAGLATVLNLFDDQRDTTR